jgi:dethiobiotin synthetase
MPSFFITAVGTEIGKTLVTSMLCHQLTARKEQVIALKPIVSGFSFEDPESDPALILRSLDKQPTPEAISSIAPWRFSAPLSPHLAARHESRPVDLDQVIAFCRHHEAPTTTLLVEGAGGIMSPLNDFATNLDLIEQLGYPIILVTGTYLGALSHTLTAREAVGGRNIPIQAIVVSESHPSAGLTETIETLQHFTNNQSPVIALPRLSGTHEQKWRSAPKLIGTVVSPSK